jgi:hypothetical protein
MRRGRHRTACRLLSDVLEVDGAEELDQLQAVRLAARAAGRASSR